MGLVPTTSLEAAKAAQRQVNELEQKIDAAKNEFRRFIRRAYLDGMPLRTIAVELGLSHQRIHQVVGLHRFHSPERVRRPQPPPRCSFCGALDLAKGDFIMATGVVICRACAEAGLQLLADGEEDRDLFVVDQEAGLRCGFCRSRVERGMRTRADSGKTICANCLEFCTEIFCPGGRAPAS